MTTETINPGISILLPTRGRTDQLKRSVLSLIDLADSPADIQWCFGFDNDDVDTIDYFKKNVLTEIEKSQARYRILGFNRLGYHRLNEYVNALAKQSTGDWMVFWNDDAVMQSTGWDTVIKGHTGKFCLQAFDTHNKHPYSIFPIVPREWLEVVGHLSLHPLNDAWLSQIAWILDIMLQIDVKVEHERFDLTGKNNDSTYNERIILEGNPDDPRDFNNISFRRQRIVEVNILANYLENKGHDMSWSKSIMLGKQDPWEKMLAADVNNQMKRFS